MASKMKLYTYGIIPLSTIMAIPNPAAGDTAFDTISNTEMQFDGYGWRSCNTYAMQNSSAATIPKERLVSLIMSSTGYVQGKTAATTDEECVIGIAVHTSTYSGGSYDYNFIPVAYAGAYPLKSQDNLNEDVTRDTVEQASTVAGESRATSASPGECGIALEQFTAGQAKKILIKPAERI